MQDISAQNDPDTALWLDFRSGDADALGALAEFHYRALYNYGTKFSDDPEFVRDCIQELFTDLWEKRESVSQTLFVKSYLFKSLRHKIFKESARLKRFQQPEELSFENTGSEISIESMIVEKDIEHQQITHLNDLISGLTNRQREIIYLRFYQDISYEEISEIMDLSRQGVSNLLYRSLKEIRQQWSLFELIVFFALNIASQVTQR